ncbi:MAG: DUF721 domain-containing protein [Alphaproteobacteria bacterium]|nr:DUF721 domain-containing protein [Alphaproteobacteria bacterium]
MKKIESLVQKITDKAIKGDARFIVQLILEWPKIVGPHLSTLTHPEKIIFKNKIYEDGRLHVQVIHSAYAFELSMQQDTLIARINGFFGRELVGKIILKHGGHVFKTLSPTTAISVTPAHISQDILKAVNHVGDFDLQQALLSLAKHLP